MAIGAPSKAPSSAELAKILKSGESLSYLRNPQSLDQVAARWCEKQRFWHDAHHLLDMLAKIASLPSGERRDILTLAAIYHDAVYNPKASDNELRSAQLLRIHATVPGSQVVARAAEIILASAWSKSPETPLAKEFFELDSSQLADECPLGERLKYERAIFREYQWADWPTYRTKRREFLEGWVKLFPQHRRGVEECMELLSGFEPRVAVYPGSFAPFHLGHLSILRQAEAIFDKVIVAVGVNRQKPGAVETAQPRFADLKERLRYHEVTMFTGLLTTFVEEMPMPVSIVRGVRDGTDLEAELRYVRFLNDLRPDTGVVWIGCEAELQHLSSSAIRELEAIEPTAGQSYQPNLTDIYALADTVEP